MNEFRDSFDRMKGRKSLKAWDRDFALPANY
jgi:hypothetical protein